MKRLIPDYVYNLFAILIIFLSYYLTGEIFYPIMMIIYLIFLYIFVKKYLVGDDLSYYVVERKNIF